jgi:sugar/nucleoside kinase (ribokinase family)
MSPAAATKARAQNGAQAATLDVIGLGDPVLDIVTCIPYETLRSLHLEAGGCMAVEEPELQTLLAMPEIIQAARRVPGGSAANVCKCLTALNHTNVAFVGMVGTDAIADEYRNALRSHDVLPLLLRSVKAVTTAKCLCMVTPDGQRTMRTFLGAALEFSDPQSIPKEIGMDGLRLLHCEGQYQSSSFFLLYLLRLLGF